MSGLELKFDGRCVDLQAGESVLEALERARIKVASSCRAGACQTCVVKLVDGPVPSGAQTGLRDSAKRDGHILACIARPTAPLAVVATDAVACRAEVAVEEIRPIGPDIALVRLTRPPGLEFAPGQFVTLRRGPDDDVARSYSLASPSEQRDTIDLHVRRIPGGRMSTWLHDTARPRDTLWLEGPKGDCQYYPGTPDEPLMLAGTGTGMAPLFAIAADAVRQGHTGPITIFQGAPAADRLYLVDELASLAAVAPNVRYFRCLLTGDPSPGVLVGDLQNLVLEDASAATRAYLCGDPALVRNLKRRLFLKGLSARRIHADPFIETPNPIS